MCVAHTLYVRLDGTRFDQISHTHSHHSHTRTLSLTRMLRAGARVAEVGPGDMLVIPPFWFHNVETLEQSVSVNVWSDAPEYALINRM